MIEICGWANGRDEVPVSCVEHVMNDLILVDTNAEVLSVVVKIVCHESIVRVLGIIQKVHIHIY
jgi:hypothetical protein